MPRVALSDLPRFTPWGTAVSVPMEAAARTAGVAVFTSPAIAWTALRGKRRRASERKAAIAAQGPYDHYIGGELLTFGI